MLSGGQPPTANSGSPVSEHSSRLPARQAIKRYWRYLVGPIAFTPFALVLTEFSNLSFDVLSFLLVVVFWVSFVPIGWLLFTNKVRYSFWLVAGSAYFAAGVITTIVGDIIRRLFS